MMNDKVIFTVEQLELIRRLRNSGLTKDQVLAAFDSFEKLDQQLGVSNHVHVSPANALQRLALGIPTASINLNRCHVTERLNGHNVPQDLLLPRLQFEHGGQRQQLHNHAQQLSTQQQQDRLQMLIQKHHELIKREASDFSDMPNDSNDASWRGEEEYVNGRTSVDGSAMNRYEKEIDENELREFLAQGETQCCEDIKAFIAKHNIKQQQIASLAGVSQPYVSRYLKGDFTSMSERCCHSIKSWFLAFKNTPLAVAPAASAVLLTNPVSNGQSPASKKIISLQQQQPPAQPQQQQPLDLHSLIRNSWSTSHSGSAAMQEQDGGSGLRRERFVFRPSHLDILDKSFSEEAYPSFERREEIAQACNEATQTILQYLVCRDLTDRERVGVQIVSNWFANKRKDMKKLVKEGLEVNYVNNVPLRSRGRPSHSSDLSLLQSIIDQRVQLSNKLPPTSSDEMSTLLPLNGCAPPGMAFDEVIDYRVNVNNASDCNGGSSQRTSVTDTKSGGDSNAAALPWSLIGSSQAIFSLANGLGPITIKMEAIDAAAVPMISNDAAATLEAQSCEERGGSLNTPPLLTSDLT